MRCRTFDRGGTAPPSVLPGHLPHKEGDWPSSLISPITNLAKRTLSAKLPISPQVGEMPNFGKEGRTEGGAKDRYRALLF
ncbi:MAG: hypothetical protein E5Y79_18180 [Mesorhizobium sp.]|nr:MAG: hypothetical protein E5Y79_18180 [Mesorhizobium sp.]TIL96066.1 MAG: hypothetical protein E5Y73_04340 [Mesorhizobium sp.]TIM50796.1 MAG: hypothetical protein E5Y56_02040 [Mesorhizobium sp.]